MPLYNNIYFIQDLSSLGDNLALSLTDSRYEGPEPQYTETKSSILRSHTLGTFPPHLSM